MRTRRHVIAKDSCLAFGKTCVKSAKQILCITIRYTAIGVLLSANTVMAQVPRSVSYQGFLIKDNQPVNGPVDMHLKIYNAGGEMLYDETDNQVQVRNGLFTVLLGGNSGRLSDNLKFDEQYYLGIEVNNEGEAIPRTPFVAAPYALNSQTVGGVSVSVTPQPGTLLPLDKNGKIPIEAIPTTGEYISTINGISGDQTGGIQIVSGDPNTMHVTTDASNNRIVLTVIPPTAAGTFTANQLTGTGDNKYSGYVNIPQNALFMTVPYTGITASSNIVISVNDPAGQTDQVTVGTITPGIGFNVFFSGYYPTKTGKLNYLVIN